MRSNFKKTTMTILLTLCMAIAMFAVNAFAEDANSTSTNADSTSKIDTCERKVKEYTATQAAKYIAGENTYPKLEGYLFAGWYNKDTCNEEDAIAGGTPSGEKAFALFVPEHVLSIQAQVSRNMMDEEQNNEDALASMRFITSVDSLLYKQVGFEVYYMGADNVEHKATSASNRVYSKLYEMGSTEKVWEKTPSNTFCSISKYFKICTLKDFPMETYMDTKFSVKPYWITLDGDTVYGVEATKTFSEGCLREEVWVSSDTNVAKDEPNYGSYSGPYASLNYAIKHVEDGGTVYVKDDFTVTKWDAHGKNITITGSNTEEEQQNNDGVEKLTFTTNDVCFKDGVTFRDIKLNLSSEGNAQGINRIFAEGHDLVINNSVEITSASKSLQLLGGSLSGEVESTNLEVYAGTYSAIYAGSATKDVLGDTNVIVGEGVNPQVDCTDHGHSNLLFGAGWSGTIHGDTNITVKEGAKFNYIYGGGDDAGSTVKGSTNIKFAGNTMAIYGGSRNGVCADTYVEMTGGYAEQVFGGSEGASLTGDTNIQILGGEVVRRIYGGSYNEWEWTWKSSNYVDGFASVTIGSQATVSQSIEGLFATSRSEENNADEQGVIILNDYKNNTYSSSVGKNELDSTIMKGKAYHYLVNATAGGTVTSAGNCIYIKPADENTTATVRLDSEVGDIAYYAEEAGYYALPELVNGTRNVYVTFGTDTVTDFTGYEAKIGLAYYAELENAIAAAEKMDNATIENLSSESLATISVADTENGTVTSSCKNCIAGETVTLTVTPNEGYNLAKLNVMKDGTAVDVGEVTFKGGTYSIVTEEGNYTVEAEFAKPIFDTHDDWELAKQYNGVISPDKESDTGYLSTTGKYSTFAFTVKEPEGAAKVFGVGGQFFFDNSKFVIIKLTKTDSGYQIQSDSLGENCLYQQQVHYTLTLDEVAKIQSDGLKVEAVRSGTKVMLYLDGERVTNLDVEIKGNKTKVDCLDLTTDYNGATTGITDDTEAIVKFKRWGSYSIEIPFELSQEQPEMGLIDITQGENGTISTNLTNYVIGEEIVITTKADSGYAYDSLTLDGKEIMLDWDGTYAFTTTDINYEIEGSFAPVIFDINNRWNLKNQNLGVISTDNTEENGYTKYLQTKGNYSAFAFTVKEPTEATKDFAVAGQFFFENGKFIILQLKKTDNGYQVQSASENQNCLYQLQVHYTLTPAEVEKVQEEGLKVEAVRSGTKVMLYLDGERVTNLTVNNAKVDCFDLTTDSKGAATNITAETTAIVKFAKWGKTTSTIEIPFELSQEQPEIGAIDITQGENGTISTNLTNYIIGEEIVLTVTADNGYAYNSLTLDGEEIQLDWDGTYTFIAEKDSYEVKGSFAPITFKEHTNWNRINQNVGVLATTCSGNTGWMESAINCSVMTMTAKAPESGQFGLGGQFYFELGETDKFVTFRIHNEGHLDKYYIQCASGNKDSIYANNKYYELTEKEVQQLKSEKGIEFKVVRSGTKLEFYLGGNQIKDILVNKISVGSSLDLTKDINGNATGITADTPATVKIQHWFGTGELVEIPVSLVEASETVNVQVNNKTPDSGTITADKTSCTIGERIVLTVTGNSGYCCNLLKINGKDVIPEKNGIYQFTTTETDYQIEASFAPVIFDINARWNLINQNLGVISTDNTEENGYTKYLQTKGNYSAFAFTVKEPAEATKGFAVGGQFYFENDKFVVLQLMKTDSGYRIQSASENKNCLFQLQVHYTLTPAEVAKIQGEGLKVEAVRSGTKLMLYLDGQRITNLTVNNAKVDCFDLTKDSKGAATNITAETTAIVKFAKWGKTTSTIEIPFELKEEVTLSVSEDIQYGTVTTSKTTYLAGDTVTLKGKSKEGYA